MIFSDLPYVERRMPLASMNTYRVGGPAQYLAKPPDAAALGTVLDRAARENLPLFLLGHGTNLLVSDAGVNGVVLRLPKSGFGALAQVSPCGRGNGGYVRLRVGAGHSLPALVKWSAAQGLRGLECLQGVPGTVGAALRMNAGGKHGEIRSSVRLVRGFDPAQGGAPFEFESEQCGFVYRGSGLSGKIVTDCELELGRGSAAESQALMAGILREKCATQPVDARSAGCVFKNPGAPHAPAGKLIDELRMKGLRVGGASVSSLHANFLVCEGDARAGDLAALIRAIRERVYRERGVVLEMEVEAWGFAPGELVPPDYPRAA